MDGFRCEAAIWKLGDSSGIVAGDRLPLMRDSRKAQQPKRLSIT
jgi:hypothetical protein